MFRKTTLLALAIPAIVAVLATFSDNNSKKNFHTAAELEYFRTAGKHLGDPVDHASFIIDSSKYFLTAKSCGGCHGHDPTGFALVTTAGEDVNIYDDWRSTMMANSAKDPFWRAKVTHEILVNPAHSLELQTKCTSCHAPAGHYQAKLKDHAAFYTLADMYADSLGLDGVTCQVCHAQAPELIGDLNSGNLNFDTSFIRVAYGPYEFVFAPPMHNFVGITPLFGAHISEAGLCAGCHTLITASADLEGNPTGVDFIEQATYHEWLNSRYDEQHDNVTCQSCHMPQLNDEIIISTNYQFLTPKSPFGLHQLAGANVTMLKLMKENREQLDINAEAEHYDSTIALTLRMLQQQSLDVSLTPGVLQGDTAQFHLKLQNKAGHKFPSGYPARRAWIEFEVVDENGQTVFHSGKPAADWSLPDENTNFEPHYNVINSPDQVQIYEMVPADVNGNFTNVLERCYATPKDNRLVPQGFSLSDPAYDTTRIAGNALNDPDFNRFADNSEGSGADEIHFHIPLNGYEGLLSVKTKIWYQSLPPKWMQPIFEYSSPEIDHFKAMYDAADLTPVLVATAELDSVFVTPVSSHETASTTRIRIWPSVAPDGRVHIDAAAKLMQVKAYSADGRLVWDRPATEVWLPAEKGMYFIVVETSRGKKTQKVIR